MEIILRRHRCHIMATRTLTGLIIIPTAGDFIRDLSFWDLDTTAGSAVSGADSGKL